MYCGVGGTDVSALAEGLPELLINAPSLLCGFRSTKCCLCFESFRSLPCCADIASCFESAVPRTQWTEINQDTYSNTSEQLGTTYISASVKRWTTTYISKHKKRQQIQSTFQVIQCTGKASNSNQQDKIKATGNKIIKVVKFVKTLNRTASGRDDTIVAMESNYGDNK